MSRVTMALTGDRTIKGLYSLPSKGQSGLPKGFIYVRELGILDMAKGAGMACGGTRGCFVAAPQIRRRASDRCLSLI